MCLRLNNLLHGLHSQAYPSRVDLFLKNSTNGFSLPKAPHTRVGPSSILRGPPSFCLDGAGFALFILVVSPLKIQGALFFKRFYVLKNVEMLFSKYSATVMLLVMAFRSLLTVMSWVVLASGWFVVVFSDMGNLQIKMCTWGWRA